MPTTPLPSASRQPTSRPAAASDAPRARRVRRSRIQPSPLSIDLARKPSLDDQDAVALFHERRSRKGIFGMLIEWTVVKQPSWLVSLSLHAVLLVMLSLLVLPLHIREHITLELGSFEADDLALDTINFEPMDAGEFDLVEAEMLAPEPDPIIDFEPLDLVSTSSIEMSDLLVGSDVLSGNIPTPGIPGGIAGRGSRREDAIGLGATKGSEEAVDRALKWLAAHQNYDGSWTFDLSASRCRGTCTHSGSGGLAKNGATALALLPFLGAGHSQDAGQYRDRVSRGLRYLVSRQARNGSFHEPQGTMYSHGLASLALCEAVAMADKNRSSQNRSRDRKLRAAAQKALDFIVESQHRQGGWRYEPGQRGDTSVVGWQAMALQSGRLGGLRVPEETFTAVTRFLNSVSSDNYGATYGYQNAAPRPGGRPGGGDQGNAIVGRHRTQY